MGRSKVLTTAIATAGLATVVACSASPTGPATSASGRHPEPCPPGALEIGRGPQLSPASGEHGVILSVTSVGPPCTVDGYPEVTLLDAAGTPIPFTYVLGRGQYVTHRRPRPVTVGGGARAYFLIAKYRCDAGSTTAAAGLNVTLPGQATPRSVPTSWLSGGVRGLDFCTGGLHPDPGNTVAISPLEPTVHVLAT